MFVWIVLLFFPISSDAGRVFIARFNMAGLEGKIKFYQENVEDIVNIDVKLRRFWGDDDVDLNATWGIYPFPVDYHSRPLCHENRIGIRETDLTKPLGLLQLSGNWNTSELTLFGSKSVRDKTLLIQYNQSTSCATILNSIPDQIRTIKSLFVGPIGGNVLIRQVVGDQNEPTTLFVDLFHVDNSQSSTHEWKILATEVFDSRGGNDDKCDRLHVIYDTGLKHGSNFDATGDLTKKHGILSITRSSSRFSIKRFVDDSLWFPDLTSSARRLYLVIYDKDFSDTVYACAALVELTPREVTAEMMSSGRTVIGEKDSARGFISVFQNSPLDLPEISLSVEFLAAGIAIYSFPVEKKVLDIDDVCNSTGKLYNPHLLSETQDIANYTYDVYAVGDLSGKYGDINGNYTDPFLQLFGRHNINGRSIVIFLEDSSRVCATLQHTRPVITVEAVFVHPVVGRVILEQLEDESTSETTVLVEGLLYADDHMNDTHGHRWGVLSSPVGPDFLNWTKRCRSAGNIYDPMTVQTIPKSQDHCGGDDMRCAVGDLTRKSGRLDVAARRNVISITRRFHTDVNLPLSGPNSVIGRTLVIFDDFAPEFRGNRMSCAIIRPVIPLSASVQSWRSADSNITVTGEIKFQQPTTFSVSETVVQFQGLNENAGRYSIHQAPVPLELDFPCGEDTVHGVFDPFGAKDYDIYIPVGELSEKYGDLKGLNEYQATFTDPNLPLHGQNSILERSVVLYKQDTGTRWLCGNIELHAPEEGEVIRALASFHAPNGFAYGYARFTQVALKDGGMSDTWIEINLKYPGLNNKNLTRGHEWAIYVNPVGYDATVKPQNDRCVAAGFKWNPFLIVDSLSDYHNECSIWTPLRCVMGDVSYRQTPIDVGGKSKIFSDSNLHLTGKHTVIGRSIVIYDKQSSTNRFACANIYKEQNAVMVIAIKNPRYFSSALFMDQARETLGVPPWFMFADTQKTHYVLEGACVQLTIHFRGSDVEWIQQIFTELLSLGYVSRYTPAAPGSSNSKKRRFGYRLCRTDFNKSNQIDNIFSIILYILFIHIFQTIFT